MSNPLSDLNLGSWTLKLRVPQNIDGAPVYLLLHGWTGDESSMWVFANQLPTNALIIAPRGLFPSDHPEFDGYSWVEDTAVKWVGRAAFDHSQELLSELLADLADRYPANFSKINLVGFSQGAALAGEVLLSLPEKVNRLAMLSGFLPEDSHPADADLEYARVFLGHGNLDEIVPLERAKQAGLLFEAAGAQVTSCFTDVGHRLGADCFRGLKLFFEND